MEGTYRVVLFESDQGGAETAYESADVDQAIAYAEEWLRDPRGLTVAIVPPHADTVLTTLA